MAPPLIHPALARLARRIHAGEVVFFVGAGFSIDSEGLSAKRLVRRLILRLHALEAILAPQARLTAAFGGVFGEDFDWNRNIGIPPKISDYADYTVGRLASRYYEINEWMIQAYAALLPHAPGPAGRDLSALLNAEEHRLAALAGKDWNQEHFEPPPAAWWNDAVQADARRRLKLGKLLFLDTVGFLDPALMAGCLVAAREASSSPDAAWSDLVSVGRSYRDNFRARHHVLARLAREGLCTTLVTTNFDLLLEGAFRLSGFCWPEQACDLAPTSVPHLDVIDSAASFYTRGKAFRTATILKLHGCARRVRALEARHDDGRNELDDYLDEVVFTYREIQNWRDDSWAADYVRTLLRTRTVVFSGYSTADPVIHDTVRNVYEEMSREQTKAPSVAVRARRWPASNAPAYFFAYNSDDTAEERQEFHGRETLRAASMAVGASVPPSTHEHPNYLRFRKSGPSEPRLGVDDLMRWLHHLVFRRQQLAALQTDLRPLAKTLLDRVAADQVDAIGAVFRRRLSDELRAAHGRRAAVSPTDNRRRRAAIRRALDWTSGFHRALLREWACGQALQRTASLTRDLQHMTHPLWYFPASERPAWTAWTAVLELALERLAELAQQRWNGKTPPDGAPIPAAPPRVVPALVPTQAAHPTVMIRRRDDVHAPQLALTLRMRGLAASDALPEVAGHPARHVVWTLAIDSLPWIRERSAHAHPFMNMANAHWTSPPAANAIWQLAAGSQAGVPANLINYLGTWTQQAHS